MRSLKLLTAVGTLVACWNVRAAEPKSATFDARHELKVTVPEGAKKVRV